MKGLAVANMTVISLHQLSMNPSGQQVDATGGRNSDRPGTRTRIDR